MSKPTTPSTKQQTILIVDDNPTNLGVLSNYLKDSGFRILVARSGDSALKKVQYVQPDLILLDIMMPGLSGIETCHILKSDETTKDIPVIFMTALGDPEDKVKGFQAGAVDYVIKPLHHAEVLARVTTHLHIRELTQNLRLQNADLQQTTDDLQNANHVLSKRAIQLETSSQVARQAASFLDMDELLQQVVTLIRSQFGYYFVGVWLADQQKQTLELHAGSGPSKQPFMGHTLALSADQSLVGFVACKGKYYIADDVSRDKKFVPLDGLDKTAAEMALPLKIGADIIGVLDIQSTHVNIFGMEDKTALLMLADQISIAIRNAQLYKAEQKQRQFFETLELTGRILSSSLELDEAPGRILKLLVDVVPYDRGSIMLQRGDRLQSVAQRGYPDDERVNNLYVPISEGDVFERLTQTRQPVLVDDVTQEIGWKQVSWLPLHYSWMGVPLIAKYRVIGMISLTRAERAGFTKDDASVMSGFASQAAVALENARLYGEINTLNEQLEQKVTQRTEQLNELNQRLERLNQTKTDFIKATSHELRTPLSVIRGSAQVLKLMPIINEHESAGDLLQGVMNGIDNLSVVVNTMLDVVKIDTDVLEIRPEPIAMASIFDKVIRKYQDALTERQLNLTVAEMNEIPVINADPDLMFKVFYNLVGNAIKYTPDGGSITVSGQYTDDIVEFIISDTGIGIDVKHHNDIFEKFYRSDNVDKMLHSSGETKFKGGGPGLGLAVVQGIVEAHGGTVWVESEKYDEETLPGSHFHVKLPTTNAVA